MQRLFIIFLVVILILIGSLTACSTSRSGSLNNNSGNTTEISLSNDVQPIFDQSCVVCHQGSQPPAGLNLQSNSAHGNLVNIKSTESTLMRVVPGHPEQSYLMNKLLGTQSQVGGSGAQIPFRSSLLSQASINSIQQWITEGAKNN